MKESKTLIKLAAAGIIILAAAAVVYGLYANRPQTVKRHPAPIVPIVEAVKISPGSEDIFIDASGTVIPARETAITAEVEGKIVHVNGELIPGGLIKEGETLVRIDPSDYLLQVHEQKAAVAEAVSNLELEEGQQIIAREEWRTFAEEDASGEADSRLALREPHLRSAKASLEAARSRLDMAELALERTEIKAPFSAVVINESAEIGQLVGRQARIATIAGTDYFWVQASILPAQLDRISFPEKDGKGSRVKMTLEASDGKSIVRTGFVEKLLAELDSRGRMARILIRIDDPLNLAGAEGLGKVLLGSFVALEIEAGSIDGVYVVPREAVLDGDRLLILKKDGTLDIREAKVRWRRKKELLVSVETGDGERLIVSRLQNPLPGMKVRANVEKPEKDVSMKMTGEGNK